MLADFHFLQPLWFLALLPLAGLLVLLLRHRGAGGAWRGVVDERLLAALMVAGDDGQRRWPLVLLGVGWLVAVVALANPTFERMPVPAFRDAAARVVALDLSQSMLADDLAPTRLARAQLKVEDILRRSADGQVALVAFAGDAFAVAPLTDDADTIRGMLPALSPEIMPAQGSRVDLGILQALGLLRQAGARDGEVVLITDGAGGPRARAAAAELRRAGHRLAVIGVGTPQGAAVPGVRTSRGSVTVRLDDGDLRSLASHGGGDYARISADDADLRAVLRSGGQGRVREDGKPMQTDIWRELGPWVALALVPFAALAFRRGWALPALLPGLLLLQLGLLAPAPAYADAASAADGGAAPTLIERWRDLWQRRDQQAAGALARGDYERALGLADDPARAGAASYRLGDFGAAAQSFASGDGAVDHYNRGNALAQSGRLDDAIAAYDAALERAPDLDDARFNREQVEALKQMQEQQPDPDDSSQDGDRQDGGEQDGQSGDSAGQQGGESDGEQSGGGADGESADNDSGDGEDSAAPEPADGQGSEPAPQQAGGAEPDRAGAGGGDEEQEDEEQEDEEQEDEEQEQASADTGSEQATGDGSGAEQGRESAEERAARQDREDQAAQDYRDEAAAAQPGDGDSAAEDGAGSAGGDKLAAREEQEARRAADQWLRRIPDDPAGLLRRKFLYQYQMRAGGGGGLAEDPW
ncbi:VWA domain-containing protein [Thiohalocapsa sp. ML1]|uniref:VWA domain-containing protein n=1 Tax=Thiohalocapsa sp. ML1 TaxID=1431688 RepID=UPI000731F88B|nr:VWA domain-containing protein [Thiohalocapsa sp. ML1]